MNSCCTFMECLLFLSVPQVTVKADFLSLLLCFVTSPSNLETISTAYSWACVKMSFMPVCLYGLFWMPAVPT